MALDVTQNAKTFNLWGPRSYAHRLRSELNAIALAHPSASEMEGVMRQHLISMRKNFFTDEPIREEQSPGNFQFLRENDGAVNLVIYDEFCYAKPLWQIVKPSESQPVSQPAERK